MRTIIKMFTRTFNLHKLKYNQVHKLQIGITQKYNRWYLHTRRPLNFISCKCESAFVEGNNVNVFFNFRG